MGSRGKEKMRAGFRGRANVVGLGWGRASGDEERGTAERDFWFLGGFDLRSRCIGKRVSVWFISHPAPALCCHVVMHGCRGARGVFVV